MESKVFMELGQVIYFKEVMMGNLKKDIQLQIMEYLKEILSIHIMEAMDFRVIKIIITET
jgi:hypothetical protein